MIRLFIASALALISMLLPVSAGNDTQTYPLLKDNPASDSYELHFIADTYMADITYHPAGNFFLVDARTIYRINAVGAEEFSLARIEDSIHLPFTPYVVTSKGIYDLSQNRPHFQQFSQIVNGKPDRRLVKAAFTKAYSQAYRDADVVVYGNLRGDISRYSAFLQIRGKWTHFYLSYNDMVGVDHDYNLGTTVKSYPAKYGRMVLLKDIKAGTYSSGSPHVRSGDVKLPEDKLKYPTRGRLKLMRFDNRGVIETVPYTPIPSDYGGMAYHRLTYDGEKIFFRERARRPLLRRVMTQLNWFVLPKPYQQKTPIGFLEFRSISNVDTAGGDGVYVLRRK